MIQTIKTILDKDYPDKLEINCTVKQLKEFKKDYIKYLIKMYKEGYEIDLKFLEKELEGLEQ